MDAPDSCLIEPDALAARLRGGDGSLRLLDASFALAGTAQARETFLHRRIGDAVFFDINDIADHTTALPHMVPTPDDFAAAVGTLGMGDGDSIVVYDQTGIAMAAARAWWMFRLFGHDNVRVLNGGLPGWERAGLPLATDAPATPQARVFTPVFRPGLIMNERDVRTTLNQATIIDARAPERFCGAVPEPRAGMRRGHIPGAVNVPYASLCDSDGRLRSADQLRSSLPESSYENKTIVSYCGSGVTACVPALAYYMIGKHTVSVYDGSWAEWGQESGNFSIE